MAYLEDLPSNDFNLLYSKYAESGRENLERNVFCATIGKTIPCNIKDGFNTIHADNFELGLFKQQAKDDWKIFMLSRGTELKRGGFMVISIPTCDEGEAGLNLLRYSSEAWRKIFSQGKISKEEYERTTLGFYRERSDEELMQPFYDPDILNLGLRIVSLESRKQYLVPLQRIRKNSDKSTYAAAVVDITRPIIRNVVYYGLSEDRKPAGKNKILEDYFSIMTELVIDSNDPLEYFIKKEIVVKKD